MRVYLDNCCYNRPFDDQSYLRISLESQAKLSIQASIKNGNIELATSYMTYYENGQNPYEMRRRNILEFQDQNASVFLSEESAPVIIRKAAEIEKTGIKHKDACHIACAICMECDYFISTDDRLLKYKSDEIRLVNPVDFIREVEV